MEDETSQLINKSTLAQGIFIIIINNNGCRSFFFIKEEPFTMEKKDTNYTGHMKYEGYCIDLLTRLQETLGFQYELYVVPDGNFGVEDPKTGQWNGMVGELVHDVSELNQFDHFIQQHPIFMGGFSGY